jgi:hypothetical protein
MIFRHIAHRQTPHTKSTSPTSPTMVQFGPTTNILSNTTNQHVDNSRMGSGNENSKKRFPVTPHPSKQRPKDGGSLPSETTNACTSQVSSVSLKKYNLADH